MSIFSQADDFEHDLSVAAIDTQVDLPSFENGIAAGRYAVAVDVDLGGKAYRGYSLRRTAMLIAEAEGTRPDPESLAIAISHGILLRGDKGARAAFDAYTAARRLAEWRREGKALLDMDWAPLLQDMMFNTLGAEHSLADYERAGGRLSKALRAASSRPGGHIELLRQLLMDEDGDELLYPARLGRMIAGDLLQADIASLRPVPMPDYLRSSIEGYDSALSQGGMIWRKFLLRGVAQAADREIRLMRNAAIQHERLLSKDSSKRKSSLRPRVIEGLFETPVIDTALLRRTFGVTTVGALKIIAALEADRLVKRIGNARKNAKYICPEALVVSV